MDTWFKDEIKSIKLYNKKYNEAIAASMSKAKSLEGEIETLKKSSVSEDKLETQTEIQAKADKKNKLVERSSKMTDEIQYAED